MKKSKNPDNAPVKILLCEETIQKVKATAELAELPFYAIIDNIAQELQNVLDSWLDLGSGCLRDNVEDWKYDDERTRQKVLRKIVAMRKAQCAKPVAARIVRDYFSGPRTVSLRQFHN